MGQTLGIKQPRGVLQLESWACLLHFHQRCVLPRAAGLSARLVDSQIPSPRTDPSALAPLLQVAVGVLQTLTCPDPLHLFFCVLYLTTAGGGR